MATTPTTTTAAATTAPKTVDYTQYQKLLEDAASRTSSVQGISDQTLKSLQSATSQLGGGGTTTVPVPGHISVQEVKQPTTGTSAGLKAVGEGLVSNLQTQQTDLQKQAQSAADALKIAGEAHLAGNQNIEAIQQNLRTQAGTAAQSFGAAAAQADEYVQAARQRVQDVLGKVDDIYNQIQTSNDFAKAHDMQAAVQASIGSMNAEGRNIAQVYGTDSAEYQQFTAQKQQALGAVQSNIHAAYAKLKANMDTTYLSATMDAYTKANTAVSYQEQQHVDMLNYKGQAESAYQLKVAELDTTLEQMKTAGMENLANWILETPTFSMDATSTIAAISDLLTTQETLNQEAALNQANTALTGAQAEQMRNVVNAGRRTNTSLTRR